MQGCDFILNVMPYWSKNIVIYSCTKAPIEEKKPVLSVGCYCTLYFTELAYKTKMFILYLCEQPTVAAPMSVTGFHYGNSAKKGHRHKNPLKCFYCFTYSSVIKIALYMNLRSFSLKGSRWILRRL